ncbi:MAG: VOC family protein [Deltaproteobacteria bacterium]|nr:VOC family protein [Deltaproteobacteria bacterium]
MSAPAATPEAAPAPRLVLVILAVRDLAAMVAFYRDLLGATATVEVPVYVELALAGGMRLGLYVDTGFASNTGVLPPATAPDALTRTELYLGCDGAGLEAALGRATRLGARVLSALAPRPWGDEAAYLCDPEGNTVVLARPLAPTAT